MKSLLLFSLVAGMVMISCKNKDRKELNELREKRERALKEQQAFNDSRQYVTDSLEIRKTIESFYNWYNSNYAKLMKFDLYNGIKKKDAPPYRINWDEVEKYQQFIRDSIPQLGEEFLSNQKRFFKEADSAFKKDLEDEIPYGFDYDWYTDSQEDPQYTLDLINRNHPWNIMIDADKANVETGVQEKWGSNGLGILMKKEKGRWAIAWIGHYDRTGSYK